jgi:hypothetical protein
VQQARPRHDAPRLAPFQICDHVGFKKNQVYFLKEACTWLQMGVPVHGAHRRAGADQGNVAIALGPESFD